MGNKQSRGIAMATRPEAAAAAIVRRMALQVFGSGYVSNRIVQVSIERTYLKPDAENIEQSGAQPPEKRRNYDNCEHNCQ